MMKGTNWERMKALGRIRMSTPHKAALLLAEPAVAYVVNDKNVRAAPIPELASKKMAAFVG